MFAIRPDGREEHNGPRSCRPGSQGRRSRGVERPRRALQRLVWGVARAHRLGDADAADVFQTTWLRLRRAAGRHPQSRAASAAWLATTARHECLRVLRVGQRHVLTDDDRPAGRGRSTAQLDERLLAEERDDGAVAGVRGAPRALPGAAADARRGSAAELRGRRRGARHAGRQHRPDARRAACSGCASALIRQVGISAARAR